MVLKDDHHISSSPVTADWKEKDACECKYHVCQNNDIIYLSMDSWAGHKTIHNLYQSVKIELI